MINILFSYDFIVVAVGTIILSITSGIIGCFSVYKGQSLIGDAIGHSAYPGVIIAFMLFQSRNPIILLLGSMIMGFISFICIQSIINNSKVKFDSALAIVLTGFFGLGMVLKTYIQGHENYIKSSQSGLKSYIFGSASYIMIDDVIMIIIISSIVLSLLFLFYKEIVSTIFDKEYSKSIGINVKLIEFILLVMMILIISLGLKMVGSILIASFLIIPCICANQHSKKLKNVLIISSLVSAMSSFIGAYLSSTVKGFSTGPIIIIVMCSITLISMVFGKYGILNKRGILCKKY